jgi:hypothetical protein
MASQGESALAAVRVDCPAHRVLPPWIRPRCDNDDIYWPSARCTDGPREITDRGAVALFGPQYLQH